ncbi:GDSL-type esterase/lipase family protein [Mycoplasmopsis synoviae]|uniref:SGNH/GDSL hydrolase family protein n=1 Tax=Mycoplasmopsis synoviae TaxID=2109 RepID=UPI00356B1993
MKNSNKELNKIKFLQEGIKLTKNLIKNYKNSESKNSESNEKVLDLKNIKKQKSKNFISKDSEIRYLAFGDSITAGFDASLPYDFESKLDEAGQIIGISYPANLARLLNFNNKLKDFENFAISGSTIQDWLEFLENKNYSSERMQNELKENFDAKRNLFLAKLKNANLITLTLGANDFFFLITKKINKEDIALGPKFIYKLFTEKNFGEIVNSLTEDIFPTIKSRLETLLEKVLEINPKANINVVSYPMPQIRLLEYTNKFWAKLFMDRIGQKPSNDFLDYLNNIIKSATLKFKEVNFVNIYNEEYWENNLKNVSTFFVDIHPNLNGYKKMAMDLYLKITNPSFELKDYQNYDYEFTKKFLLSDSDKVQYQIEKVADDKYLFGTSTNSYLQKFGDNEKEIASHIDFKNFGRRINEFSPLFNLFLSKIPQISVKNLSAEGFVSHLTQTFSYLLQSYRQKNEKVIKILIKMNLLPEIFENVQLELESVLSKKPKDFSFFKILQIVRSNFFNEKNILLLLDHFTNNKFSLKEKEQFLISLSLFISNFLADQLDSSFGLNLHIDEKNKLKKQGVFESISDQLANLIFNNRDKFQDFSSFKKLLFEIWMFDDFVTNKNLLNDFEKLFEKFVYSNNFYDKIKESAIEFVSKNNLSKKEFLKSYQNIYRLFVTAFFKNKEDVDSRFFYLLDFVLKKSEFNLPNSFNYLEEEFLNFISLNFESWDWNENINNLKTLIKEDEFFASNIVKLKNNFLNKLTEKDLTESIFRFTKLIYGFSDILSDKKELKNNFGFIYKNKLFSEIAKSNFEVLVQKIKENNKATNKQILKSIYSDFYKKYNKKILDLISNEISVEKLKNIFLKTFETIAKASTNKAEIDLLKIKNISEKIFDFNSWIKELKDNLFEFFKNHKDTIFKFDRKFLEYLYSFVEEKVKALLYFDLSKLNKNNDSEDFNELKDLQKSINDKLEKNQSKVEEQLRKVKEEIANFNSNFKKFKEGISKNEFDVDFLLKSLENVSSLDADEIRNWALSNLNLDDKKVEQMLWYFDKDGFAELFKSFTKDFKKNENKYKEFNDFYNLFKKFANENSEDNKVLNKLILWFKNNSKDFSKLISLFFFEYLKHIKINIKNIENNFNVISKFLSKYLDYLLSENKLNLKELFNSKNLKNKFTFLENLFKEIMLNGKLNFFNLFFRFSKFVNKKNIKSIFEFLNLTFENSYFNNENDFSGIYEQVSEFLKSKIDLNVFESNNYQKLFNGVFKNIFENYFQEVFKKNLDLDDEKWVNYYKSFFRIIVLFLWYVIKNFTKNHDDVIKLLSEFSNLYNKAFSKLISSPKNNYTFANFNKKQELLLGYENGIFSLDFLIGDTNIDLIKKKYFKNKNLFSLLYKAFDENKNFLKTNKNEKQLWNLLFEGSLNKKEAFKHLDKLIKKY